MPRSRRTAKDAGTRTETAVTRYLAEALDDDRIERRSRNGSHDRGDVTGLRIHGQRLVAEIKDRARTDLAGWIRESHTEAAHDDALCGVVIAKRRGTTNPAEFWVHMTLADLVALITGQPQEGRYE